MSTLPRVCIATALAQESRPIRRFLRLRRADHPALPCPLYASEDVMLVETGPGKLRAAAMLAANLSLHPSIRSVLNVGLAGGCGDLGSLWLGHTILDGGSGRRWYPELPAQRQLPDTGHTLIETVDAPTTDYRSDRVFDMEAAGLCAAAVPVIGTGGVCYLKVLSDGPDADLGAVKSIDVDALLEPHLPTIHALTAHLSQRREPARAHQLAAKNAASCITAAVHHSESERHQLQRLLSRHLALKGTLPDTEELSGCSSAAVIAAGLQERVEQLATEYQAN